MNVKISVKKLHRMEQFYLQRMKENKRQYRGEVEGWRKENEYLTKSNKEYRAKVAEMFNDREDFKQKIAEADASLTRMDERIQAYMKENDEYKKDIEILSHQLKHSRKLADNWSKEFVNEAEEIKALKVLHEKEIKLLEQRNDALDEQCEALKLEVEDLKKEDNDVQAFQLERKKQMINQAETINYLTDENDALKAKVAMMEESLSLLQKEVLNDD